VQQLVSKKQQVAQLSQRDRAAGWVSFGQKLEDWNGWTTFCGYYRPIFNHCGVIASKAIEFGEKIRKMKAIMPFKVIQGHRGQYQSKGRIRIPISD